jgi:hypothetical protein
MRSENRISNINVSNNFMNDIPTSTDTAKDCCKVISATYLFLIILMGILGYYIFGINYVVVNSLQKTKDFCPDSNVWIFTVVSLVVRYPLNSLGLLISSFTHGIQIRHLIKLFVINSLFIIWGSIELWVLACTQEQTNYPLYNLLRIDIIITITVICLLGVFIITQ